MLKDVEKLRLNESERPKVRVEQKAEVDSRTRTKEINWRRFKAGI